MILLVTYDLHKPIQKYPELYESIHQVSNNNYSHCLDSTWLIDTGKSPKEVYEYLKPIIDDDDSLLVIRVDNSPKYSGWLRKKTWDWLNSKTF